MLKLKLGAGGEAAGLFFLVYFIKFSFLSDGHNLKLPVPAKRHPGRLLGRWHQPESLELGVIRVCF